MENRVKELNDISSILDKSRKDLDEVLSKLGWTKDYLAKSDSNIAICPVDDGHVMALPSLGKHTVKCRMDREGIEQKDLCPSSHFFYKNSFAVVPVLIDKQKYDSFKNAGKTEPNSKYTPVSMAKSATWTNTNVDMSDILEDRATGPTIHSDMKESMILQHERQSSTHAGLRDEKRQPPKSSEAGTQGNKGDSHLADKKRKLSDGLPALPMTQVIFDMTPTQRLAVYDYVVQTAKTIKRQASTDDMTDSLTTDGEQAAGSAAKDGVKTHLEAMAEIRDYKRRRQSYRAKNVHMTKRTGVEVMRDLIETQMKMLEEQYMEEHSLQSEECRISERENTHTAESWQETHHSLKDPERSDDIRESGHGMDRLRTRDRERGNEKYTSNRHSQSERRRERKDKYREAREEGQV